MRSLVLDTSVILKWLPRNVESLAAEAEAIREAIERGSISLTVAPLFFAEAVNVIVRKWHFAPSHAVEAGELLENLGLTIVQPPLSRVMIWANHGLTGYDATWVALAEYLGVPLITADVRLARLANDVAASLADFDVDAFLAP